MSEINNDLKEEAVVTEPVAEVSPKTEEAVVAEVPAVEPEEVKVVEEAPVVKEEKPKAKKEAKVEDKSETVAIFSKTNLNWSEMGKLSAGYNILPKADADKWLTIKGVRLASPEELAAKVAK